jgi:hypothetical protein
MNTLCQRPAIRSKLAIGRTKGRLRRTAPALGTTSTPDEYGYWEIAADGRSFVIGDAASYGSVGGTALNKPIVGIG